MYIMQPIHYHASRGNINELLNELDVKHIDIDLIDQNDGTTCLHNAANNGHVEIVKLLIERKANIYIQDKYLETPLFRAVSAAVRLEDEKKLPDYDEISRIILRYEAKLHYQYPDKYKTFLKDIKNDNGMTPLSWPERSGKTQILLTLQNIISEVEKEQQIEQQQNARYSITQPTPIVMTSQETSESDLTYRRVRKKQESTLSSDFASPTPKKELSPRSFWSSVLALFSTEQKRDEQQPLISRSSPTTPHIKAS